MKMINEGRRALVIMAKAPIEGCVKTRLCPYLNAEEAAALYECLLSDIVEKMETFREAETWLAHAPEGSDYFHRTHSRKKLLVQRGEDLGERLHHVFIDLFRKHYRQVVIIDSDSPTVPLSSIARAYECLGKKNCDLVLGPSLDGGYYLVGMKRAAEEIFRAIPWSTRAVLDRTLEKASALRFRVRLLPRAYDIDNEQDLARLWRDLTVSKEVRHLAPKTFAYLARLYHQRTPGRAASAVPGMEERQDESRR